MIWFSHVSEMRVVSRLEAKTHLDVRFALFSSSSILDVDEDDYLVVRVRQQLILLVVIPSASTVRDRLDRSGLLRNVDGLS